MESIIFSTPLLLILYGVALFLSIFDLFRRASGYLFSILSALLFTGATCYALLLGASYEEAGLVTLVFLALHLAAHARSGGNRK